MENCFIGCSGYYYPEWKEIFYPKEIARKDWLRFYAEHFNSLEINNTFYRYPAPKLFKDWFERGPQDFKFSVKVPRVITQYRKFNDVKELLDDFYRMSADGLMEKLGCILFQLPPSFHYSDEHLERILKHMDPAFLNVIEFRHPGWWNEKVYQSLKANNVTFCSISHPVMPDNFVQTSDTLYVRFHGRPELYKSDYNTEELTLWANKIRASPDIKNLFIYFNNTMTAKALNNAREIKELLNC